MITLLNATANQMPLLDASMHCAVLSPPYWGLRDYGLPPRVFGGIVGCRHVWGFFQRKGMSGGDGNKSTLTKGGDLYKDGVHVQHFSPSPQAFCQLCGAWRGCLGLEPTPEMYVQHMVEIFREIWRVLRGDGTVWLNLGDSYAGGGYGGWINGETGRGLRCEPKDKRKGKNKRPAPPGLKPKDLVGIPWRVAFALQADGWWLRSDIIWSKTNPMPESVTDRPTKAHEYVFLLSKSKTYYYDADAVREPAKDKGIMPRGGKNYSRTEKAHKPDYWLTNSNRAAIGRNKRTVWTLSTKPYAGAHFATYPPALVEPCIKAGTSERGVCPECGAPWERVIEKQTRFAGGSGMAGRTAEQVNASGKWQGQQYGKNIKLGPVVSTTTIGWLPTCNCYGGTAIPHLPKMPDKAEAPQYCEVCGGEGQVTLWGFAAGRIVPCSTCEGRGIIKKPNRIWTNWQTSYETIHSQRATLVAEYADKSTIPATVLDPFVGSGTTLLVARQLGRNGIGLDLSFDYLSQQARKRLELDKLTAWEQGHSSKNSSEPLNNLPLFERLTEEIC